MNKTFFIKQNSTLPTLDYDLSWSIRNKYEVSEEMLKNVAVTFSMFNTETGRYSVVNKSGEIIFNEDVNNIDDPRYLIRYCFTERETRKCGNYGGEFVVDFLDSGLKLKLPINKFIDIIITPSKTKTEVVL